MILLFVMSFVYLINNWLNFCSLNGNFNNVIWVNKEMCGERKREKLKVKIENKIFKIFWENVKM